jgi:hypothetical protein
MKEDNNHEKSALLIQKENDVHYNSQETIIRIISVVILIKEIQTAI